MKTIILEPHPVCLLLGIIILMNAHQLRGKETGPMPCQTAASGCNSTSARRDDKDKEIQFKMLITGEIEDENKVPLNMTNFLASDGVGVTVISGEFSSATAAEDYYEKVLAKALKITEHGKKRDATGNVVGKRAVGTVPVEKSNKAIAAVLFTSGKQFYEIQSHSERHCRIMESRITQNN